MRRFLAVLFFPLVLSAQTPAVRDLEVEKTPDNIVRAKPVSVPDGYALIIGISTYKNLDGSQNLEFPESDAEATYRALISPEGGAFPPENVHKLLGSQATIANIRHELEDWLPSVAKPEDRVVVYFAGHGLVKNGRGYLAAWDVSPANLENTAYSMTALGNVIANKIRARWKVLLADACHSGKINAETSNEKIDAEMRNLPGNFLTLTSTTEREKSYEDRALSTGFGLFSYFLVQAWRGYADADCDGIINADEMIEYVRREVREYAKGLKAPQTPTARGDYDPQMLLGVSLRCLKTSSNSPQTLGVAIISKADMEGVRVYVDGMLIGTLKTTEPLVLRGLSPGLHQFEAVREGYDAQRQEILIVPGQEVPVTFRKWYAKEPKKAALELDRRGEDLLASRQSVLSSFGAVHKQDAEDLKKARDYFQKALQEDPQYSKAAFHLGQVNQLLSDREASIQAYKRALEIDPSNVDALVQYSAILIEDGDVDAAIRRLEEALRLESSNDEVYALMARAYWDKGKWDLCIKNADRAIQLDSSSHQAYLWKADALRQQGAIEKNMAKRLALYEDARENYLKLLSLTNFDSTPPLQWVAFHFVGFGLGGRRHADRAASFDATRVAGFLGVCLSDQKLGNLLHARDYCQRALKQDPNDPIAYFVHGNVNRDLYNRDKRCDYLKSAKDSYSKMVKLNKDLDESKNARAYLEQIELLDQCS
jgi:tetratricopeptide (TPR) repeat protein